MNFRNNGKTMYLYHNYTTYIILLILFGTLLVQQSQSEKNIDDID